MNTPCRRMGILALALLPGAAAAAPPGDDEKPFPVERTTILREEKSVYFVEGRVRIPRGVEITCLKDVHIKARGSGPAVIEVEGSLKVHGVKDREVIFENVTVEPQPTFKEIRMDQTIFRDGGGVKTPKDKPVDGDLMLELFDFTKGASMEVTFTAGAVELSSFCSDAPVSILVVDAEGSRGNKVKVNVRGCDQPSKTQPSPRLTCAPHGQRVGFAGGLRVEGADEIIVRLSRIAGELLAIRNWNRSLIVDGLKVNSKRLEIACAEPGRMARAQCIKCDIYSETVSVRAPPVKGKSDTFVMERCWFRGIEEPRRIHEEVLRDSADDPEKNGATVHLLKPKDRPYELGGPWDR